MMTDLHHYELNLKKDDLYINLSSDDVYFISKQMDKWFRILLDDSYVPVSAPVREPVAPQAPAPEPLPVQPPAQPLVQEPVPQPVAAPEPLQEPVVAVQPPPPVPQVAPLPAPEPVLQEVPAQSQPAPLPAPVPVVESVEQPVETVAVAAVASVVVLNDTVQDDFEAVMDSLMKDLGEPAGAAEPASLEGNDVVVAPVLADEPEQYLDPQNEREGRRVDFELIESLSDLCEKARAATPEHYLLLSAFYLTYFEGQEKFSLKRINALLVGSGLTPVNHSVLEAVLSQGYLSMVPDLTGMADITEYMLTDAGVEDANGLL